MWPAQAYMSDALGVGAFLESSDEQVVLLKRAEHLAEAPGLWDIPGGHPEPQVTITPRADWLVNIKYCNIKLLLFCLQAFGTISWASWRAFGLYKLSDKVLTWYLSGVRCKWFACDAADATATLSSLASLGSWFRGLLKFWEITVITSQNDTR